MTGEVDLAQRVLKAVEGLTEEGSVGFYASAIVAITEADPSEVTRLLLKMVDQQTLEPRFELRCPDNGRRIASYPAIGDIPFGEEIHSDRCDSADPFVVDETDIYVRFSLSKRFTTELRRRKHKEGGGNPGKAHQTWIRRGSSPQVSLRPNGPLSRR